MEASHCLLLLRIFAKGAQHSAHSKPGAGAGAGAPRRVCFRPLCFYFGEAGVRALF